MVEVSGPDVAPDEAPVGGPLVGMAVGSTPEVSSGTSTRARFEPPVSALAPLFRARLERIYSCEQEFVLDINTRPTVRVLGGYYRRRRLVRVYSHDRQTGRRPMEELFDTFLHEVAHHIEYSEPHSFNAAASGRVRGRMHSRLFWRILGELKARWGQAQQATDRAGTSAHLSR